MSLWHKMLLAGILSWAFSVILGLLFAADAQGVFSLDTLRLPGVVPVALIISTVVSIVFTPLAVWSFRTGGKNLYIYAPILWVLLAAYIVLIVPRGGRHAVYGLVIVTIISLIILGFVPRSNR